MTEAKIDLTDAVAVTQRLVQYASVTPAKGAIFDELQSWFESLGFSVERPTFCQEGTPDVENLYARLGTSKPHLMFAGHVDVVPTGEEALWGADPFDGHIENDILYGRGTVDMKGGIGAFIASVVRYLKTQQQDFGSISFLITGDEEGPAINGSVKLLEWAKQKGEEWDHCLLGEPTNTARIGDVIKVGRRGSLTGAITITGQQGHVAYPHLAANPLPKLAEVVAKISSSIIDDGTDVFQPTNLEFINIDVGNDASNVIPQSATARFNIRFNDLQSPQSLETFVKGHLDQVIADPFHYELSFEPCNSHVFRTQADGILKHLQKAIFDETGAYPDLTTGGGTSDGRFIKDYCPIIEFGLVGKTMHKIDEHTPIQDLSLLSAIFERTLISYFK